MFLVFLPHAYDQGNGIFMGADCEKVSKTDKFIFQSLIQWTDMSDLQYLNIIVDFGRGGSFLSDSKYATDPAMMLWA